MDPDPTAAPPNTSAAPAQPHGGPTPPRGGPHAAPGHGTSTFVGIIVDLIVDCVHVSQDLDFHASLRLPGEPPAPERRNEACRRCWVCHCACDGCCSVLSRVCPEGRAMWPRRQERLACFSLVHLSLLLIHL